MSTSTKQKQKVSKTFKFCVKTIQCNKKVELNSLFLQRKTELVRHVTSLRNSKVAHNMNPSTNFCLGSLKTIQTLNVLKGKKKCDLMIASFSVVLKRGYVANTDLS